MHAKVNVSVSMPRVFVLFDILLIRIFVRPSVSHDPSKITEICGFIIYVGDYLSFFGTGDRFVKSLGSVVFSFFLYSLQCDYKH